MLRKQSFIHFTDQLFLDSIDKVYELAPNVDVATSSDKDPNNARISDVSWIDANENSQELFQEIYNYAMGANKQGGWEFEAGIVEPLQFTEYKIGQRYDWHVDHMIGELEETVRKISFSILLNDDFEGGEFQFEVGSPAKEERIYTVDLKKGDLLFFPSYQWHRVLPVTKGVRHSLVGWVRGPQWK
jgi:PKHD-type hydroxylase